jgi:aspartate ammonia-lyase
MVTAISPYIGYDAAAKLAKEAYESGKTVLEIAVEKDILPEVELKKILNPYSMTNPK